MPNIDRLEAVYNHVLAHPEDHDQTTYGRATACGAAHCIAGWTLVLSDRYTYAAGQFFRLDDQYVQPAMEAAGLLGLDPRDCFRGWALRPGIFSMHATLADIRFWIDQFRLQEGLEPRRFNTTRNIDLMERVWDQICEHPELHDQTGYTVPTPCGTAHCVGGWALVLSGYNLPPDSRLWRAPGNEPLSFFFNLGTPAQTLLGLTYEEAWSTPGLFQTDQTPRAIREAIDKFRVEAGLPKRLDGPTYRAN